MSINVPIGMTACPRTDYPLQTTITSMRSAGFTGPLTVFGEPGVQDVGRPDVRVLASTNRLGGPRNYMRALRHMLNKVDGVGDFMLVEDDVEYGRDCAEILAEGVRAHPEAAAFSLYLPKRYGRFVADKAGWFPFNLGPNQFGLLAVYFRGAHGINRFVHDPQVVVQMAAQRCSYDSILFHWFTQNAADHPCYNHRPSLVDHRGWHSNQRHADGPHRRGLEFCPQRAASESEQL